VLPSLFDRDRIKASRSGSDADAFHKPIADFAGIPFSGRYCRPVVNPRIAALRQAVEVSKRGLF
jgi:hypothetical protein